MDLFLEITAVILGILYVVLAAKNNNWCWIFGILGSLISIYLFIGYAKLYAEAGLYVFYVIAGFYGWFTWENQKEHTEVYSYDFKTHALILLIGVIFSLALFYVINLFFKDAQKPLVDSFTTIFGLIATYLTAKKWISSWIYWVVINLVSTYLYFSRGLEIYALLMFSYSFIAIYGYFQWKKLTIVSA